MISGRALEGGDGFDDYIHRYNWNFGKSEKIQGTYKSTSLSSGRLPDVFFFFKTPLKIILSQSILCYLRLIIQSSEQFVSFE